MGDEGVEGSGGEESPSWAFGDDGGEDGEEGGEGLGGAGWEKKGRERERGRLAKRDSEEDEGRGKNETYAMSPGRSEGRRGVIAS